MLNSSENKLIIQYLLGKATAEQQATLEERYFADDEFFEQLLAMEDELIDAYVRGELSASDNERFERLRLSSPKVRERVASAKGLIEVVSLEPKAAKPEAAAHARKRSWRRSTLSLLGGLHPALRIAFVIVVLSIMFGGIWLSVEKLRQRGARQRIEDEQAARTSSERESQRQQHAPNDQSGELRQRETGQQQSPPQQPRSEQQAGRDVPPSEELAKRQQPRSVIALFVLTPGLVRAASKSNNLMLARSVNVVRLQVYAEEMYPRYSAALETIAGEKVWSRDKLQAKTTPRGASIVMELPAAVFSGSDYILTLRGTTAAGEVEAVGEYALTIVKK